MKHFKSFKFIKDVGQYSIFFVYYLFELPRFRNRLLWYKLLTIKILDKRYILIKALSAFYLKNQSINFFNIRLYYKRHKYKLSGDKSVDGDVYFWMSTFLHVPRLGIYVCRLLLFSAPGSKDDWGLRKVTQMSNANSRGLSNLSKS